MSVDGWSLGELPGARRFFARVNQAVDDGRNVVVVVPNSAVQSGLAQQISDGMVQARCVHAALDRDTLANNHGSIPEASAIAADFMDPLSTADRTDRWQAYLHHDESGGKSILVSGWYVDLSEDISYWLRLIHGSSLDPEDRPSFVFVIRDTDVDVEQLEKEHAANLSVMWWWDVLGLLDSELCADLALSDRPASSLRRAMLSESIGWELELAEECARMWGIADAPTLLAKVLTEQGRGTTFSLNSSELAAVADTVGCDRPPHVLRQAWNDGNLNAWEGQVLVSSRYCGFSDILDRRFWSAQARILMPYLERQRQRVATQFAKLATARIVDEVSGESGLLELNKMLKAHNYRKVDFGRDEEVVLRLLVLTRNKIAHHQSLDDDLFAEIAEILS